MSQSIYGIDLAKHGFSIHGEDSTGKVLIHKTRTRSKVLTIPLSSGWRAAMPFATLKLVVYE